MPKYNHIRSIYDSLRKGFLKGFRLHPFMSNWCEFPLKSLPFAMALSRLHKQTGNVFPINLKAMERGNEFADLSVVPSKYIFSI